MSLKGFFILVPDRLLQFENFSFGSFKYFLLTNPEVWLTGSDEGDAISATWVKGSFVDTTATYGRVQVMGFNDGLDFMWQHFSPFTNIIDPSPTNIIDAYIITRGYYDNMIMYLRNLTSSAPEEPSSFELRNSYSEILEKKMMSDTVVMHSGKFKLLFGANAEPQLRAKFKVVRNPTSSLSNERIREEVLYVINKYFELENWDFGKAFHATDRIAINYERKEGLTFPVIGISTAFGGKESGNKLTKSNTVACRGNSNTTLAEFGSRFTIEPYGNMVFKLIGDTQAEKTITPEAVIKRVDDEL
jgi:hypothetical protein